MNGTTSTIAPQEERLSTQAKTYSAYLLGYEDANSFFRAFHEWEDTSPG